jgi:DNA-binding beta-propeller fold protein YncE
VWVANSAGRSVSVLDEATGDETTRIGFETGVHGIAAADGSIWVLDLHGPRVLDNLKGTTIWRFDPATAAP